MGLRANVAKTCLYASMCQQSLYFLPSTLLTLKYVRDNDKSPKKTRRLGVPDLVKNVPMVSDELSRRIFLGSEVF
jgi:hypothetical protein